MGKRERANFACWPGVTALGLSIFVIAVSVLLAPLAVGQAFDTGTINGVVTDPSGAVVPHAQVTTQRRYVG